MAVNNENSTNCFLHFMLSSRLTFLRRSNSKTITHKFDAEVSIGNNFSTSSSSPYLHCIHYPTLTSFHTLSHIIRHSTLHSLHHTNCIIIHYIYYHTSSNIRCITNEPTFLAFSYICSFSLLVSAFVTKTTLTASYKLYIYY